MAQTEEHATISSVRSPSGALTVVMAGRWSLRLPTPPATDLLRALDQQPPTAVSFDCGALTQWDGSALAVITLISTTCTTRQIPIALDGLPEGASRLLTLAANAPSKKPDPPPEHHGAVERVGLGFLSGEHSVLEVLSFVGELCIAFGRMVLRRSRMRGQDVLLQAQLCGANALGIIVLVCFLVSVILAFVGAIEFKAFGAEVYVSNLVGVSMVREMGALMVGIVIAGRTGAAFAAELGTMKVNQEIDALATLDISVMEFLVLPRVIALALMMPLLTLFADLVGILGGALIGISALGLQPRIYYEHTLHAITMPHLIGGLAKATTYGILIGVAGCLSGLRAGHGAASVGNAATSAVVNSLVLIIIACGIYAVTFYVVGI